MLFFSTSSTLVITPESLGSVLHNLFKLPVEVRDIVISGFKADLGNRFIGSNQQLGRVTDPEFIQDLGEGLLGVAANEFKKRCLREI